MGMQFVICAERQRWKDENESCHGEEKKCWEKADEDMSGRNKIIIIKKNLQQQATAVPPWSWPPYEEMEEECRLKGKGLEKGLWLHRPQRKPHSGNCSVHKNNEGVYIIHLWARNTLGWLRWRERKEEAENLCLLWVFLLQAPQLKQEHKVYQNPEGRWFVWSSRRSVWGLGLGFRVESGLIGDWVGQTLEIIHSYRHLRLYRQWKVCEKTVGCSGGEKVHNKKLSNDLPVILAWLL